MLFFGQRCRLLMHCVPRKFIYKGNMLKVSTVRKAVVWSRLLNVSAAQQTRSADTQMARSGKSNKTSQIPQIRYIPATTEQIQALSPALDGIWHEQEVAPVLEGNFYNGEFVEGRWHGQGKLHLKDGTVYSGEFFAGRRNGHGTLTRADGSQLVGVWDNGRLSETIAEIPTPVPQASPQTLKQNSNNSKGRAGHNKFTIPRANLAAAISNNPSQTAKVATPTYTPHTSATVLHTTTISDNKQTITYSNGDIYTGAVQNEKKHGHGVLVFADGGRYEGEWRDNLQHGQGTAVYPFGATYTGQWKHGLREGTGTVSYVDGQEGITGEFRQNKVYNGSGRYVSVSGAVFTGSWVEGLLEGQCSIYSDVNSQSVGEFKQGKVYRGTRVYRDAKGRVHKVTYEEGKQVKSEQIKSTSK